MKGTINMDDKVKEVLRKQSQDYAVMYVQALEDDNFELASGLTKEHLEFMGSQLRKILEIINNGLENDVPKQHILFAVQKFCEDGDLANLGGRDE